jgi:hypothetical protein
MSTYFCDAAQELPDALAGDLYVRFLGWLDPHHRGHEHPAQKG